ncbi:DUF6302 family protein [Streptomyces sp. NPDC008121]|uniref:DUF6302 family protein n=1 Tax=Streptomyces sp. NPDC008121 TaxID=3364809 RepID=UPI0036EB7B18
MSRKCTQVLPPGEAYNYAEIRFNLHPSLADSGISVHMGGIVPAGGRRRGGFFPTGCAGCAVAVRGVLQNRPGFPDPRVKWSFDEEVAHNVRWGAETPVGMGLAYWLFYGFSDAVIHRVRTGHPFLFEHGEPRRGAAAGGECR